MSILLFILHCSEALSDFKGGGAGGAVDWSFVPQMHLEHGDPDNYFCSIVRSTFTRHYS